MKKLIIILFVFIFSSVAHSFEFETRVLASSDDAEESVIGTLDLTSTDLELVYDANPDSGNQPVGIRFNGVDIPQGAKILNAYIQFQVDEITSEQTSLLIQGENVDDAQPFSSSARNISSRTRTSYAVGWWPAEWTTVGEAGLDQRTSDISSIIMEIVDRPGWTSGNSLAVIITGNGERVAESYDGDPSGAPLLHVEYTIPNVWHVDGESGTDPVGCDGGDSWATALKTIQKAVDCASAQDEIWLKAGTYVTISYPPINVDKEIAIYGGFAGNETKRWQRDWEINETIIDWQLAEHGGFMEVDADTIIEGLSFTASSFSEALGILATANLTIKNCIFSDIHNHRHPAIRARSSATLIIADCDFLRNSDFIGGVGVISAGGSTTITGSTFIDNYADESGTGAIFVGGSSIITNCTFYNNYGQNVGAIEVRNGPCTINKCEFYKNHTGVGSVAGAISFGYGFSIVTNSIFRSNYAVEFGENALRSYNSSVEITNCTFLDNGIINEGGTAKVTNSILWGDTSSWDQIHTGGGGTTTVTYCDIDQDGYEGIDGNIRENPLFRDPDGPDDIPGTMDDDLHLLSDSPCINAGTNDAPGLPETDKDGQPRIMDVVVDMGAYEYSNTPPPCGGQEATIIGTDGDDIIIGTDGDDVIVGLGGNDIIYGLDGKDRICGGDGDDTIYGGQRLDKLWGDAGNDILRGEGGQDLLYGGAGNDSLDGGGGPDRLSGGGGNDTLYGAAGDDLLIGDNGLDVCDGGIHITGDTADDTCELTVNIEVLP